MQTGDRRRRRKRQTGNGIVDNVKQMYGKVISFVKGARDQKTLSNFLQKHPIVNAVASNIPIVNSGINALKAIGFKRKSVSRTRSLSQKTSGSKRRGRPRSLSRKSVPKNMGYRRKRRTRKN